MKHLTPFTGIDVHDSKCGTFMEADKHNALHSPSKGAYNEHWREFLKKSSGIEDSAARKEHILNHMEDIRAGKVKGFAAYYKDSVSIGSGLNYQRDWHWKSGSFSSKQRGQVITAALDSARYGRHAAFEVGAVVGRKMPVIKYAMMATAFSAGQTFAQDKLKLTGDAANAVAAFEALNPTPLSLETLYDLRQDDIQMAEGRAHDDRRHIYQTGIPLNAFNYWKDQPPREWTDHPSYYYPELLHHWGLEE